MVYMNTPVHFRRQWLYRRRCSGTGSDRWIASRSGGETSGEPRERLSLTEAKSVIRTTCPRDCYDTCGIAVVKRNGAVTKVLGDPDHPVSRGALCGKCALAYNGVWRDPAARLARPL